MKLVRQALKQLNLSVKKSTSKRKVCEILGKHLFQKMIVIRKDDSQQVSFDNLKLTTKN